MLHLTRACMGVNANTCKTCKTADRSCTLAVRLVVLVAVMWVSGQTPGDGAPGRAKISKPVWTYAKAKPSQPESLEANTTPAVETAVVAGTAVDNRSSYGALTLKNNQAIAALNKREYKESNCLLEECVSGDRRSQMFRRNLSLACSGYGVVLLKPRKFEAAASMLQDALDYDVTNKQAHTNLHTARKLGAQSKQH